MFLVYRCNPCCENWVAAANVLTWAEKSLGVRICSL